MLLHAALSDPGPYGQRTRTLADEIQRYLARPRNRGKACRLHILAKAIGASASEINCLVPFVAQIWLELNQDAPLAVKTHYSDMLATSLGKLDPEVGALISRTIEAFPRLVFVSKERAQTITSQVTAPMTKEFVKVYETRASSALVQASPLEAAIARVRDAYITAPIGDTPSVSELMAKQGLLDDGKPVKSFPDGPRKEDVLLTEGMVRERQLAEDWRGQRGKHVVRAFDIVPEEVKLVAIMRSVEAHRILFQHLKAISHIYSRYYQTGEMPALDGKGAKLKMRPDPSVLASLAETMRRMLDGSGEKVSITLNQTTAAQQSVQAEGAKADVQISQATKEYLARMATMTDGEIEAELGNMDRLRLLLANGGVTGEAAGATATLDVEASDVPLAKS